MQIGAGRGQGMATPVSIAATPWLGCSVLAVLRARTAAACIRATTSVSAKGPGGAISASNLVQIATAGGVAGAAIGRPPAGDAVGTATPPLRSTRRPARFATVTRRASRKYRLAAQTAARATFAGGFAVVRFGEIGRRRVGKEC